MSVTELFHQHPPGCGCGDCTGQPMPPCDPCSPCPPEIGDIEECWKKVQALRRIIEEILADMPMQGPIKGVTDGSKAKAGDVGEIAWSEVTGTFGSAPQSQALSVAILQPGDWDVQATVYVYPPSGQAQTGMTGVGFQLNPIPAGVDAISAAIVDVPDTPLVGEEARIQIQSPVLGANVTVPTLLAFMLTTNAGGNGAPGNFSFAVRARRMR